MSRTALVRFNVRMGLVGVVDEVGAASIGGWVYRVAAPQERLDLELVEGDTVLATARAGQERADLVNAGRSDGRCAFSFATPPSLLDGEKHTVTIRLAGAGDALLEPVRLRLTAESAAPAATTSPAGRQAEPATDEPQAPASAQPRRAGPRPGDQRWITTHDTLSEKNKIEIAEAVGALQDPPLVSLILLGSGNPAGGMLSRTLGSLEPRSIPRWEMLSRLNRSGRGSAASPGRGSAGRSRRPWRRPKAACLPSWRPATSCRPMRSSP